MKLIAVLACVLCFNSLALANSRRVTDGSQEGTVSANVIHAAGIPNFAYLIGSEQVRQQFYAIGADD